MINKYFVMLSVKEEIKKVMESKFTNDIKKQKIGTHLLKISKNYGIDNANKLISEFELTSLGINFVCPILEVTKEDK